MAGAFGFITTDACFAPNLCFKVVFSACAFTAEAVTAIKAAIKSVEFFISNMFYIFCYLSFFGLYFSLFISLFLSLLFLFVK